MMSYCWPNEKFDCVVGVWSLSSVKLEQVENLLVKIDQSMKVLGHLVLIEPVLDKSEKQQERVALDGQEQHMVRSEKTYRRFFRNCQYTLMDSQRFWWSTFYTEYQMLFVLKKEI